MPERAAPGGSSSSDEIAEIEEWFLAHGLPYFVLRVREEARAALRPRRFVPPAVVVALVAVGGAGSVAWLSDELSAAPAILVTVAVVGVVVYALTAARAGPIVGWAGASTTGSLRLMVPMVSRALPLLLVFVTFLFINAEAWQMAASLTPGLLWTTVVLLAALAVVFLLVRLPEEVDRVDDAFDDVLLRRRTDHTPAAAPLEQLLATGRDPSAYAQVKGYPRANLVLVLLVVQIVQVLLLVAAVFGFFLLFGSLVMRPDVQASFIGLPEGQRVQALPYLSTVSVPLVKVSLFLAAFSGLYFTVSAVTDDAYRGQFFASVTDELERAVGVRAVYLALLDPSAQPPGVAGVE